jgi:hypothetical protein
LTRPAAIAETLGEPATYTIAGTGAVLSLRAITRRDVVSPIGGMEQGVQSRRTIISIRSADLAGHVPAMGDTISVPADGAVWKVLALEADNGYIATVQVRPT